MKLFSINEQNEVVINFPWIKLIPEFDALFNYREGKANVRRVNKDTLGKKLLAYVYFMEDFTSPIITWEEDEKKAEALRYTNLTTSDIDDKVEKALETYATLQYKVCRPLKTYKAVLKSLDAMDQYFETINLNERDKQGKLLYTPNQLTTNITTINKAYEELAKLEKSIEETISQQKTIRGTASLGDREMKQVKGTTKVWEEKGNPNGDRVKWANLTTKTDEDD